MEKKIDEYLKRINELERELKIYKKKLERSELSRKLIEQAKDHYDLIYRSSIEKLGEQKQLLDIKNRELNIIKQELLVNNEKLLEASITDRLTKLFNRGKISDLLNEEISRCSRYETDLSVILIDIDRFKLVNDTYGHQAGDTVLIEFTQLIKSNLCNHEYLGRWGGEEFLIILPFNSAEDGFKLAERLRLLVCKHTFHPIPEITCSFGIAQYCYEEDAESIIKKADIALYKAKEQRNKACVYI